MKINILALIVLALGLTSCHSGNSTSTIFDSARQAMKDDSIIKAYINQNHIPAIKDPSGFYYQIIKPGTGAAIPENATVQVNYEGKMPDGTIFDKTTDHAAILPLHAVIPGWTKGIPLVKVGGKIMLLIPSALGYGTNAAGPIPENSVLIFTIDVLNVQ